MMAGGQLENQRVHRMAARRDTKKGKIPIKHYLAVAV